ncbi:MAG: hypothetical protein Q7W30_07795 [Coriobacteriia bacterium]|nr:hypothetical protein [Coriobacteriia bacterium]
MVTLTQEQLDALLTVTPDGDLRVDRRTLVALVSSTLGGDVTPSVSVSRADYAVDDDGSPVLETRSATGLWWVPDEHDEAVVGVWLVDGRAFTVTEEGITLSPVALDESIVARATAAAGAVPCDKPIRTFVVRDARVTRPQDLLEDGDMPAFDAGELGVVLVIPIGAEKALMRRFNC